MSEGRTTRAVSVQILDKEYLVACAEHEYQDLLASAQFLDRKMREIRDGGKVVGMDRIAVMAALNLAHELLGRDAHEQAHDKQINSRIRSIQEKIDEVLYKTRQLEL